MKISLLTRLTGLFIVAGFLYSCGSSQATLNQLLETQQYNQALEKLGAMIVQNPNAPDLYIQRAEVAALLAQSIEPEQRSELYQVVAEDFDLAEQNDATDAQLATIDSLKQQFWKEEHNAGLRVVENDSLANQYQLAVSHFTNAITIWPEAVSSYQNLAIAQFQEGEIDKAIASLTNALNYIEEPPVLIYENLGYLHLEKGEAEDAIHYYTLANKNVEDDLNLTFGLVNAYVAAGNSEQAIQLLEPLVEKNPQNTTLRNVYGTQLYKITEKVLDDLKAAYKSDSSDLVEQLRFEAVGMGEKAETQLTEAFKRDTLNTDYIESLAVFYNNLSGNYFSLVEVAYESDRQNLEEKALKLVDFAIRYYSKLTEIEPNNEGYQEKLNILKNLKQNRASGQN